MRKPAHRPDSSIFFLAVCSPCGSEGTACVGVLIQPHRLCWGRPVRQFCCPTSSHNPKKWLFVKPIRVVSAFHLFVHDVLLGLTFLFACYFCAALALAEICPAVYLSSALGLELAKKRPRNMGLNLHACSSATYFLVQLTQDPYSTTILNRYSSSPLLYTHVDSICACRIHTHTTVSIALPIEISRSSSTRYIR